MAGHGDRWAALGGEPEDLVERYLPLAVQEGKVVAEGPVDLDWLDEGHFDHAFAIAYPDESLQFFTIAARKAGKMNNAVVTAFPYCRDGVRHEVIADGNEDTEGYLERVVRVQLGRGMAWFFDPLCFVNEHRHRKGESVMVELAGLAYSIAPIDEDYHTLIEDPERIRELRPPEETEGKADHELEPVKIMYAGGRGCFPDGESPSDHNYITVIEEVSDVALLDISFYKLRVGLWVEEDESVTCINLYVSRSVCDGYVPKVGDAISGWLWLQGTIVDP